MHALVLDFETVPNLDLFVEAESLQNENTDHVLELFETKFADSFPPVIYHKIVAAGIFLFDLQGLGSNSILECFNDEIDIVKYLCHIIDELKPSLVTWNGSGFDLPLLQYKMMQYSIPCKSLMDKGFLVKDNKWNNYRSRYHEKHIDLCDAISNYGKARASLDLVSKLIGLPGKRGIGSHSVLECYKQGKILEINDYCKIDVINTTMIYLRYLYISGIYTKNTYEQSTKDFKAYLLSLNCEIITNYVIDCVSFKFKQAEI